MEETELDFVNDLLSIFKMLEDDIQNVLDESEGKTISEEELIKKIEGLI